MNDCEFLGLVGKDPPASREKALCLCLNDRSCVARSVNTEPSGIIVLIGDPLVEDLVLESAVTFGMADLTVGRVELVADGNDSSLVLELPLVVEE